MEWGFHLYFGETEFEIGFGEINRWNVSTTFFFTPSINLCQQNIPILLGAIQKNIRFWSKNNCAKIFQFVLKPRSTTTWPPLIHNTSSLFPIFGWRLLWTSFIGEWQILEFDDISLFSLHQILALSLWIIESTIFPILISP